MSLYHIIVYAQHTLLDTLICISILVCFEGANADVMAFGVAIGGRGNVKNEWTLLANGTVIRFLQCGMHPEYVRSVCACVCACTVSI